MLGSLHLGADSDFSEKKRKEEKQIIIKNRKKEL